MYKKGDINMDNQLVGNNPLHRRLAQSGAVVLLIGSLLLLTACGTNVTTSTTTSTSMVPVASHVAVPAGTATGTLTAADTTLSPEGYGAKGAEADDRMSVADMLLYALQDEYLAHGEYEQIMDVYGSIRPYENIIKAETTHIAYLNDIYDAYGLPVPADDSATHLVVPDSLLDAARIGVQAEIDNIAMYDEFLSHSLPEDIEAVFTSLRDGSVKHLAAFEQQVVKLA